MGMGEKKARAKAFKQQTDMALSEQVMGATLFSGKAVEVDYAVECMREPSDVAIAAGDKIRLVDMRDQILVFLGVQPVGYVMPELMGNVRGRFDLENKKSRSTYGVIVDVNEFSPTFIVTLR